VVATPPHMQRSVACPLVAILVSTGFSRLQSVAHVEAESGCRVGSQTTILRGAAKTAPAIHLCFHRIDRFDETVSYTSLVLYSAATLEAIEAMTAEAILNAASRFSVPWRRATLRASDPCWFARPRMCSMSPLGKSPPLSSGTAAVRKEAKLFA
jgi:hypothetical protein